MTYLGQIWPTFTHFARFLGNCLMNFLHFAANDTSWHILEHVWMPFWLNHSKWVNLTYLGQIWPTFTYFATFLTNRLMNFRYFAANKASGHNLQNDQMLFWFNHSKWVKLTYLGQIWHTFTLFTRFLANCLMNFLHFAANDTSLHILEHV